MAKKQKLLFLTSTISIVLFVLALTIMAIVLNRNEKASKPNYDYHHVKCEIMFKNITNITSNNQSISLKGPKFGKYYFSIN